MLMLAFDFKNKEAGGEVRTDVVLALLSRCLESIFLGVGQYHLRSGSMEESGGNMITRGHRRNFSSISPVVTGELKDEQHIAHNDD